jgi:phosphatidylserine/phosphatidylglycerophosphate/cardiolipin synthase-like enzyme
MSRRQPTALESPGFKGLRTSAFLSLFSGLLSGLFSVSFSGCAMQETVVQKPQKLVALAPGEAILVQSVPQAVELGFPQLPTTQEVWLHMIQGAKQSIDWACFYVASARNQPLDPILEALRQAAARGVRVRMIFDKQMGKLDPQAIAFLQQLPGAAVRLVDFNLLAGGSHHAKFLVVDRREVFVGSQNFDWRSLLHIHELGVRISHPHIAGQLAFLFEMDFSLAQDRHDTLEANPPVMPRGPLPDVEVGVSPPQLTPDGIRPGLPVLLDVIRGAKQTLVIQLLRYSAHVGVEKWDSLEAALIQAAGRGVKVQLLVSNWSTGTPEIDDLKALSRVPGLDVRIVTIPEVPGTFIPYARVIHSKYAVADGQVLWLGSTNWERGMFLANRNVDVVLKRPALAAQVQTLFGRLFSSTYAEPLDLTRDYVPPRIR